MAKYVVWLIAVVFFLAIEWSFAIKESTARNLYVAEKLSNRLLGRHRRDVLSVEWRADEEFVVDGTESQGNLLLERLARKKRQATDAPDTGIQKSVVHLNDSHNMMYINWAGAGSEVIVAVTRDQYLTSSSTSRLYISYNYGKNFTEKFLLHDSRTPAVINYFLNSPVYNSHYVFVDVVHSAIWTTRDYGVTLEKHTLQFVPQHINLHPTNDMYMIGYDYNDFSDRLWVSSDFGSNWRVLHSGAHDFSWGVPPYDYPATVYIRSAAGSSTSSPSKVLRYSDFRLSRTPEELFTDSIGFEIVNEFLFVTKRGSSSANYTLELWVSYNRGTFQKAFFPSRSNFTEFFIADATEDQVFVCACINSTSTNLYISGSHGTEYSLSLENIMYYSPSYSYYWLSGGSVPFADLRKIEGLNGIYIATQIVNPSVVSSLSSINQITLMTFNKGGDWRVIPAPETTRNGSLTCGRTSLTSTPQANCSLHLVEKFLALTTYSRFASVFTSASAIGLVMANGNIGSRVSSGAFNVYLSNDGGLRWNEVLGGTHFCTMGDHGGLIVAIRMYEVTGDLMYSYDEGETWNSYTFIESPKIRVYGLLTEPGEVTTVFSIFGSWANSTAHSWIVIQVNLSSVLGRPCTNGDYKQWAPTDDPNIDCLLGRKTVYERRKADAVCFNGRQYDREVYEENCPCKIEDYECDVGYRKNATNFNTCEYDPASGVDPSGIPAYCPEGSYYNQTKGYRRVVGDTCEGGLAEDYEPVRTICPVARNQEFLLFVNRTSVHRYIFERRLDEILPLGTVLENAISLDYDYINDCIFWADSRRHNIQTRCLRGSDVTTRVLVTENTDLIEGLAYNWMSQQLFWVDSGHKRIEVARKDGTNRKVLVNTTLDQPRAIVLYPKLGYMFWTDWSATNPRITRSAMDGSNMVQIVSGSDKLHWPNGLAIDEQTMKIFITDAYLDQISCFDFSGQGFTVVYQQSSYLQHPYAIGVFKDQLYWTDWSLNAVMIASTHGNQTIRVFLSGIPGIMDLKVFHVLSHQGQSACTASNGGCQSLCFEKPTNSPSTNERVCHCSDVFTELPNGTCTCAAGETLSPNGTCHLSRNGTSCAAYQYSCANGNCIPQSYQCDGDNDCLDWSDELSCAGRTCLWNQFMCNNGRCIPASYLCDHDNDCGDRSDEPSNCSFASCAANQFQCYNGRCILSSWHCDYDNDCQDGSDELNCTYTTRPPTSCSSTQFQCVSSRECIPRLWICDRDRDCSDGSDEANCTGTIAPCAGFLCNSTSVCLSSEVRCNGRMDCADGSDEQGCTTTLRPTTVSESRQCLPLEFKCASGQWCIPYQGICDGISECPDNSDETGCSCPPADHFRCSNGRCIQKQLRCNMRDDCRDNSDEIDCGQSTVMPPCPEGNFQCGNGDCIPEHWVCDGLRDCTESGGDDEWHCGNVTTCSGSDFQCFASHECIAWSRVCDKSTDCLDGSDELDCNPTTIAPATCLSYQFTCVPGLCLNYQMRCDGVVDCFNRADEEKCNNVTASLSIDQTTENSMTIKVNALSPNISQQVVRFFVLLRFAESRVIADEFNTSNESVPCTLSFNHLSSDTEYLITVAVMLLDGTQGPPSPELRLRTRVSRLLPPSPPQNVTAVTVPWNRDLVLNVSWAMPSITNGALVAYKIYIFDLSYNQSNNGVRTIPATRTYHFFRNGDIAYGHKFKIEISATNPIEGRRSDPVTVAFAEDIACVMLSCSLDSSNSFLESFNANSSARNFSTSIYLSWSYNGNETADGLTNYSIRIFSRDILFNQTFTYIIVRKPQDDGHKVQVTGLNPGTSYSISITSRKMGAFVSLCPNSVCESITTSGIQLPNPNIESAVSDVQSINVNIICDLTQMLRYSASDNNGVLSVLYKKDEILKAEWNFFSNTSTKNIPVLLSASSPVLRTAFTLSDLTLCDQYCFVTMLTWPLRSLLSPIMCASPHVVNAAPSEFRVEPITIENGNPPHFVDVVVSFIDRCRPPHMNYFLSVNEVGKNTTLTNYIQADSNDWSGTLRHLLRGATYNITAVRDSLNSTPGSYFHTVDPFSAPTALDLSMYTVQDSIWMFSWEFLNSIEVSDSCPKSFGIYYSNDMNSTSYTLLTTTSKDYVTFLGKRSDKIQSSVFIKVRLESCYGYPGKFSEVKTMIGVEKVELSSSTADDVSSNSVALAVAVPLVIIMVIILAILGVLCGRHYLLRRSLQRFEESRYESHSNSAMFSDLADDDVPLVQNFSEDVPMIVP